MCAYVSTKRKPVYLLLQSVALLHRRRCQIVSNVRHFEIFGPQTWTGGQK